jgi:hypothetical protein
MRLLTVAATLIVLAASSASAAVVTIPQSALIPSTVYYTDTIGGGIGSVVVTTGGGNGANVGDPSGRNDDGFSGPKSLGFTLSFFGTPQTQFFVNNNGNISFGAGISAFTPTGPTGAAAPVISPFFSDVDTRNAASGVVHIRQDIPNELIVTWDSVGYFNQNADKLNSFQLVVRGPGFAIPTGEGAIGFFYKTMQWEVGDASGGSGGFCPGGDLTDCTPGAVGFGDGAGNGEVLQGSINNGIASVVNDHHIWFDVNLQPIPPGPSVPEPTSLVLIVSGFAAVACTRLRRRRS